MRQDDVAVLQTLTPHDLDVGDLIDVAGVGDDFDDVSLLVRATPEYLFTGVDDQGDYTYNTLILIPNQVLFENVGDDVGREAAVGTIDYSVTVTWIVDQDVLDWLGIDPATLNDELFVTVCTDAATRSRIVAVRPRVIPIRFRLVAPMSNSGRRCTRRLFTGSAALLIRFSRLT